MTHIMKIDEFVNENFNSVNDNQIKNFIKNHKVAFDYFVELCKDEENYPEAEDVIEALRSLGTNNDITDEEYNFLIANFDAVWSYYLKHPDLNTMNESAMMKNQYGVYGGYHCAYIAFTSEIDERRLKLDRSFPTLEEAVDYAAKIEADCIYSYTLAAELCDIFGYQNIEDMLDCGVILFNPYSGSADAISNIKEYNDLVKYVDGQYNEVRINYYDEDEGVWCVDAYKTSDDDEEGTVVAKITEKGRVVFTNPSARNDKLVNETIDDFIKNELHTTRKNTMNESAMSPMTDEYRIFIIDKDDESVLKLSDEKFIEIAERNGTVWSLEGFQENWNYDSMTMPNPDFSYMRITDKFGKSVKVNDHKYYVYLVSDDDYDNNMEESDLAFTDLAERNGNYWTLASFQDTWNNNSMFMGDPDYSYIRILKK